MSVLLMGDAKKAVWGMVPDLPLQLSPEIVRYKIRARKDQFARIFLKLNDRVEDWYLGCDGEHLFPFIQKGENRRGRDSYSEFVIRIR
jgi:hypothetical protein